MQFDWIDTPYKKNGSFTLGENTLQLKLHPMVKILTITDKT